MKNNSFKTTSINLINVYNNNKNDDNFIEDSLNLEIIDKII